MKHSVSRVRQVLSASTELSAPTGNLLVDRLDVLRTIAVLFVFFDHASTALGFQWRYSGYYPDIGRAGVLFFFIHTSLVLMFSLQRQVAKYGMSKIWSVFMIRRIFRLYPLSIFVLSVVLLFRIPATALATRQAFFGDPDVVSIVTNMLLIQDFVHTTYYFDDLIVVLWTLTLEIQMYLLLPLIFVFIFRNGALQRVTMVGGISVVAMVVYSVFAKTNATVLWETEALVVNIPSVFRYAPAFAAGVIAYVLWWHARERFAFWTLPLSVACFVFVQFLLTGFTPLSRDEILIVEILMCLPIGMALPFIKEPSSKVLSTVSGSIAKYSYGIYLVHVPCIWVGMVLLRDSPLIVQFAVAIGLTFALAIVLFHLIEQPMIRLGGRLSAMWARSSAEASHVAR